MRKFLISAAIIGLVGGTSLAMAQDHDQHGGPGGGNASHAGGGNAPHPSGGNAPHVGGGAPHAGGPGGPTRTGGGVPQARGTAPAASRAPNPAANGRNAIGQREMREHHDTPSAPAATPPAAAPNAMRGNANAARGNSGPSQNFNRSNSNGPNSSNNAGRGNRPDNNRPDVNRPNTNSFNNNAARGGGGQRHDFSSARNFHQNFNAQRRFHAPAYRRPQGYYARRWTWGQVLPSIFWAQDYWLTDYNSYDLPPPPFGATWVRVGDDALLIDQDSGEIIEVDYGVFY